MTETHSLATIINNIDNASSIRWFDLLGIEIEGLEEALLDDSDDYERACEIESAYVTGHGDDVYLVTWPENVKSRSFNGDASYQIVIFNRGKKNASTKDNTN